MKKMNPVPLREASIDDLARVKVVFFDIDDTFSGGKEQHRILPEAYDALWKLQEAGIATVPVTGRPAGWCDMITRMWPVTMVIGENGAFYSYMDHSKKPSRLVKKYLESNAVRSANERKLKSLHNAVLGKFPNAKVPSDQRFREFDLAIDYCEDVPRWKDSKVQDLLDFCREKGAIAKLSSIHVNIWFGKYDKLTCVRRVLKNFFRIDLYEEMSNVVYIGDSPNDEPFFEKLEFTVGVANVQKFLGKMQFAPKYVTDSEGGLGFAELAKRLLEAKAR